MIRSESAEGSAARRVCRAARAAALAVVVLGIALRFALLGADPGHYDWLGYFTDEGRWTHQARARALFPGPYESPFELHSMVAPLYQLAVYGAFEAFGVGITSSRLLSAVAGSAVLVAFWAAFRSATTPQALLLALVALAFQEDMVALGRIAVPEMPVVALELFLYLAIMAERQSGFWRLATGLGAVATVGMKLTAFPTVAILSLLVLRRPTLPGGRRLGGALWYLAGAGTPVLIAAAATAVCCGRYAAGIIAEHLLNVRVLVGLSGLYDAVTFPIESPVGAELNVWLLALWYAVLGWLAARPEESPAEARRHLTASLFWAGAYVAVMQLSVYFPNRYKIHVLVPMCIAIAMGVGMLERASRSPEAVIAGWRGWRGGLGLALLALPTAALAAPLVAAGAEMVGAEPFRMRTKFAALGLSLAVAALVSLWGRRTGRSLRFYLVFPALAGLAWVGAQRVAPDLAFWQPEGGGRPVAWFALLGAAALLAAIVSARRPAPVPLPAAVAAGAAALAVFSLVQLAPEYLRAHYTIPAASRGIGALLDGYSGLVGSSGADGLFRENTLRYNTVWNRQWPARWKPDVLVTVFEFKDADNLLGREYCLVGEFPLYVAPAYYRAHSRESPTSSIGQTARVYRRCAASTPEKR